MKSSPRPRIPIRGSCWRQCRRCVSAGWTKGYRQMICARLRQNTEKGHMQQVDEHVVPVRVTEHLWITLSDGTRLAARLWLPDVSEPVPAVLEYIPYRKSDGTRG